MGTCGCNRPERSRPSVGARYYGLVLWSGKPAEDTDKADQGEKRWTGTIVLCAAMTLQHAHAHPHAPLTHAHIQTLYTHLPHPPCIVRPASILPPPVHTNYLHLHHLLLQHDADCSMRCPLRARSFLYGGMPVVLIYFFLHRNKHKDHARLSAYAYGP